MKRAGVRGGCLLPFLLGLMLADHASAQEPQGAPGGQPARPAQSHFVFTRAMSGTYLKTPQGERLISFAHGDYVRPRLLPGQSKVLLNSRRGGRPGIWIADVAEDSEAIVGAARERLCDGDQVSVSPDGRLIVFRRAGRIVQRELSSGAEKMVSPRGWQSCAFPSFHPDGRVLFVSADRGRQSACLADPRRPSSPQLLFGIEARSTPRCSPDGRAIAYQNGAHIYLFALETKSHQRLTFAGGVQSWPMWSADGERLAYLQSPSPLDGPRHVYSMRLDEPTQVSLVVRDVEPGPDWNGLGLLRGIPSTLPGGRVGVWQRDGAARSAGDARGPLSLDEGWSPLPADGAAAKGDVIIDCEWGALHLSAATGSLLLMPTSDRSLDRAVEICLVDRRGRQARHIASVKVAPPGVDRALVTGVFRADGAGAIEAAISVSRTAPVVQIAPMRNLSGLVIEKPLELAVVPDRLANDLLYLPSHYASPAVPLPRSAFVLGMAADKSGLLMVATPSGAQRLWLPRDETGAAFAGVEAQCADGSVVVSMIPGGDLWRSTELKPEAGGKTWQAIWSNAFPAQWRLAAQGERQNFAIMSTLATPTRESGIDLQDSAGLTMRPSHAIIYLYGRSQNTPLDRTTPMDVLRDALGIEATAALLDIEGVRTYRHAETWVAYKDPRVALEILSWIRRRERPGAQQKIDDVCGDILTSLQGLDMRLAEYEAFAAELQRIPGRGPAGPFRAFVDRGLAQLRAQLSGRSLTPRATVAARAQTFRSSRSGSLHGLKQVTEAALSERLHALSAHREFARSVRDAAGLAIGQLLEARDVCGHARELSGQVLRKRCYLEGDWRGEQPLGGPEVPYDKITEL